jgi:hypothetical protein
MARAALARHAARQAERDPGQWGVSAEILQLPTSANVTVVQGNHEKIIAANRSDPFDLMHAAGGLNDDQHRAARRLFRAWCFRAGVRDSDRSGMGLERIDGGRRDPSAMVTDAMVDAGRMVAFILKGVGPVNAKVLEYQIVPMIERDGGPTIWRWHLERATGEKERHAQGAILRQACENLRLVLDDWDEEVRRGRARQAA